MEKHWEGYLKALGTQKPPHHNLDTAPFNNTSSSVETGFLEWKPPNANIQKKYDAMNSAWEGVQASEKAITAGDFQSSFIQPQTNSTPKK